MLLMQRHTPKLLFFFYHIERLKTILGNKYYYCNDLPDSILNIIRTLTHLISLQPWAVDTIIRLSLQLKKPRFSNFLD